MGAPEGNQFWKLRAKHGRDKLFASAELLWEAACEYFDWVESHPLLEEKAFVTSSGKDLGSDIETKELKRMRPFTLNALCIYLDCGTSYFRQFKKEQGAKKDNPNKDFLTVIEKIEETIYNQKFEGASAGFFNANIISRDLGLKDHSQVENNLKVNDPSITVSKDGNNISLKIKSE